MILNPAQAYAAGYALRDGVEFRHVVGDRGTLYTVPDGAVLLEVVLVSAGHGDILGAPLALVEAAATGKRAM